MKEVKLVALSMLNSAKDNDRINTWSVHDSLLGETENNLASLLNEGWEMAGTGGQFLDAGFVILVRER